MVIDHVKDKIGDADWFYHELGTINYKLLNKTIK
jgi:hypothetical protein